MASVVCHGFVVFLFTFDQNCNFFYPLGDHSNPERLHIFLHKMNDMHGCSSFSYTICNITFLNEKAYSIGTMLLRIEMWDT